MSPQIYLLRFGDDVVAADGRRGPFVPPAPVYPTLNEAQRAQLDVDCQAAGQITYVPSANTTGLLPGWELTDLTPVGNGTTGMLSWGTVPIRDSIVWAGLNASTSGASAISNSAIAGPRPDLWPGGASACLRDPSINTRVWSVKHCIINPLLWTMPELNPPGGAWDLEEVLFLAKDSIGIRGMRFRMEFTEMVNIQDPMNLSTILTSTTTDELISKPSFLRHSWIHAALFYKGAGHSQPEGTHSDLQQWSKPMYHTSEYNLFGGPKGDTSGYLMDPARETSDGAHNSGIMAQQENWAPSGADPALGTIKNVTIRRNIFWQHDGNGWNINHYYNPSYPNPMTTVSFADNLHVRGAYGRNDGKGVIRNNAQYAARHTGHRWITMNDPLGEMGWTDDGALTPANGG